MGDSRGWWAARTGLPVCGREVTAESPGGVLACSAPDLGVGCTVLSLWAFIKLRPYAVHPSL